MSKTNGNGINRSAKATRAVHFTCEIQGMHGARFKSVTDAVADWGWTKQGMLEVKLFGSAAGKVAALEAMKAGKPVDLEVVHVPPERVRNFAFLATFQPESKIEAPPPGLVEKLKGQA